MPTARFTADKATVRAELERRARARQTITYSEMAAMVGRTARGLGKILMAIRAEETAEGRSDLSRLVVKVRTGLPSYVGAGQDARERAIAAQEAVFAAWTAPDSAKA